MNNEEINLAIHTKIMGLEDDTIPDYCSCLNLCALAEKRVIEMVGITAYGRALWMEATQLLLTTPLPDGLDSEPGLTERMIGIIATAPAPVRARAIIAAVEGNNMNDGRIAWMIERNSMWGT